MQNPHKYAEGLPRQFPQPLGGEERRFDLQLLSDGEQPRVLRRLDASHLQPSPRHGWGSTTRPSDRMAARSREAMRARRKLGQDSKACHVHALPLPSSRSHARQRHEADD
eukprot:757628-Hanusia_phi.AAC.5